MVTLLGLPPSLLTNTLSYWSAVLPAFLPSPRKHPLTLVCCVTYPRRSQTPILICCVACLALLRDAKQNWSPVFSAPRHYQKSKLVCVSRTWAVPTITNTGLLYHPFSAEKNPLKQSKSRNLICRATRSNRRQTWDYIALSAICRPPLLTLTHTALRCSQAPADKTLTDIRLRCRPLPTPWISTHIDLSAIKNLNIDTKERIKDNSYFVRYRSIYLRQVNGVRIFPCSRRSTKTVRRVHCCKVCRELREKMKTNMRNLTVASVCLRNEVNGTLEPAKQLYQILRFTLHLIGVCLQSALQ